MKNKYDAIVIGAGAAGLFCAGELAKKLNKVLILEMNKKPALKVQISGGGRCNFTNLSVTDQDFESRNRHFHKSALSQFSSHDFIELIEKEKIEFYEKKLGQLFCKKNSKEIINWLLERLPQSKVELKLETRVKKCFKKDCYIIKTDKEDFYSDQLIVASGGLSFPNLGVSDLGYRIAKNFDMEVTKLTPSLVPLTLEGYKDLAGVSLPVEISINKKLIKDDLLFTHRGFSGPAILKASLYSIDGKFSVNFIPEVDLGKLLNTTKKSHPQTKTSKVLKPYLPHSFLDFWFKESKILEKTLQEISHKELIAISDQLQKWEFTPSGTEGYKKAEVTKGGVSTSELSSKTMESKKVEGLYFIGEVVDVTGLLGGYNFQWAWSSAYVAAKDIRSKYE